MIVSAQPRGAQTTIPHPVMRLLTSSTMICTPSIGVTIGLCRLAYHAPQDPFHPGPDLLRGRRPPRELHARRAGTRADAERGVAPDHGAGGLPGHGAVPPHAPRRGAHAGRRRLRAPDRAPARRHGARHARRDGAPGPGRLAAARGGADLRHALADSAAAALCGAASRTSRCTSRRAPVLSSSTTPASTPRSTPARPRRRPTGPARSRLLLLHEDVVPVCSPALLRGAQAAVAGRGGAAAAAAAEHPARRLAPVVRRPGRGRRRARAAVRATSCSRCWRSRPRTAWAWR